MQNAYRLCLFTRALSAATKIGDLTTSVQGSNACSWVAIGDFTSTALNTSSTVMLQKTVSMSVLLISNNGSNGNCA